ncbi:hypothetical protein CLV78_101493 [Aliiruegeria haliotis]|uniref:Uncharacterized protein n=1 Tax=Aliiruegeria haliotis TaxID=1280846 RepID=A0A2T0RZ02_9RHOB|nr:hypothetical protein [Aliiruegeria haliotis]PRY26398.1 hypothetical protein CLV78_101493 [Aliiruegeria haliotis]
MARFTRSNRHARTLMQRSATRRSASRPGRGIDSFIAGIFSG